MSSLSSHTCDSPSDALLIEEMISRAFSDFAPYAGAEQQQLRLTRQQSAGTTTSLVMEDDGGWSVALSNPFAGTIGFSTTRDVSLDLRAVLPIPRRFYPFHSPLLHSFPQPSHRFPWRGSNPPLSRTSALEMLWSPALGRKGVGLRIGPIALRANAGAPDVDPPNTTKHGIWRRTPIVCDAACTLPLSGFWGVSFAAQRPMGSAVGDTLGAVCVQARPMNAARETFQLLLVQTLATSGDLSDTRRSWSESGTLVGVSAAFAEELVRVSASSMMHDGEADFEAAIVLDATPLLTNPTLLKVGFNKMGRVGVGIATRVFENLTVMLGVHNTKGGDTRFGLEITV